MLDFWAAWDRRTDRQTNPLHNMSPYREGCIIIIITAGKTGETDRVNKTMSSETDRVSETDCVNKTMRMAYSKCTRNTFYWKCMIY